MVLPKVGTDRLHGIVRAPIEADLVKLHTSLSDEHLDLVVLAYRLGVLCVLI